MKKFLFITLFMGSMTTVPSLVPAEEPIDMKEVRALAKLPVNQILKKSNVDQIQFSGYWQALRNRTQPMIMFFYINRDTGSQRVATLIHYVAPLFSGRIDFRRIQVQDAGKPTHQQRQDRQKRYDLDAIPGILLYDNVSGEMVLEDEDYIDPDFKEFRTPRMLLWKTYHSAVRRELEKLLAD